MQTGLLPRQGTGPWLIVAGGDPPPRPLCASFAGILAADGGLALLQAWQWTADAWIGDADSGPEPGHIPLRRRLDTRKDWSDTEAAVLWARESGLTHLILAGGAGGRLDHTLANWDLFKTFRELRGWWTAQEEGFVLDADSPLWERDLPPGHRISVKALGPAGIGGLHSSGLRWPLATWNPGSGMSLSNEALGAGVRLECREGRYLVFCAWGP